MWSDRTSRPRRCAATLSVLAGLALASMPLVGAPAAADLPDADRGRDAVQLAYSNYDIDSGRTTLTLTTLDGHTETLLDRPGFFIARFDWSPDGQHVALSASESGEKLALYTLDVTDGALTKLAGDDTIEVFAPLWSPDGTEIAYNANRDVHVIGADGIGDRVVARGDDYTGGGDWDCGPSGPSLIVQDWSPNGDELLLSAIKTCFEYIRFDLAAVAVDGTDLREVVEIGGDEERPSFSPDGTRIAFNGIHTINRDGSDLRTVTDGTSPSWAPDGTLAFTRAVYDNDQSGIVDFDVWVTRPTVRRVTAGQDMAQSPTWSPDSSVIGFLRFDGDRTLLSAVPVEGGDATIVSRRGHDNVGWYSFRPLPNPTMSVPAPRLAGIDRYATAAAVARAVAQRLAEPPDTALLARGDDFPDGLTAANLGTVPLLLTPRTSLHTSTIDALEDLNIRNVTIVGGTAAVSAAVENDLRNRGYAVQRIAGVDRYDTSARTFAAASAGNELGSIGGHRTVLVAGGESFADAVAAGPIAAGARLPILLTTRDRLPAAVRDALDECSSSCPTQAVILGGTAAVGTAVENELRSSGLVVRRVAGSTRQATAAAVARLAIDELGWELTHANVARGDTFPDALAAGPLGGVERAPTLLTRSALTLGTDARVLLHDSASSVTSLHVLGDASAVSSAAVLEARRAVT